MYNFDDLMVCLNNYVNGQNTIAENEAYITNEIFNDLRIMSKDGYECYDILYTLDSLEESVKEIREYVEIVNCSYLEVRNILEEYYLNPTFYTDEIKAINNIFDFELKDIINQILDDITYYYTYVKV